MNNKLLKGSLAGVAAIALAAGGTTFAAWSDFGLQQTGAGAGMLKLDVSSNAPTQINVKPFELAPGKNKYQEMFLASANGDNVPVGALTARIVNLDDVEDGAPGCTTNSEAKAEAPSHLDEHGLPTNPSNDCGSEGELSQQATVQIVASDPVPNPGSCPSTGGYHAVTSSDTLAHQAAKAPFALGNLAAGQGVCVRVEMTLPFDSSTDASQGDQSSWDWRFDLEQIPS